eukprot:NODE_456_length_7225_cov_1.202498.p3 type:complete len:287 gc:universal NODE_456_length_7225_cov_1.202498:3821-2961(-)
MLLTVLYSLPVRKGRLAALGLAALAAMGPADAWNPPSKLPAGRGSTAVGTSAVVSFPNTVKSPTEPHQQVVNGAVNFAALVEPLDRSNKAPDHTPTQDSRKDTQNYPTNAFGDSIRIPPATLIPKQAAHSTLVISLENQNRFDRAMRQISITSRHLLNSGIDNPTTQKEIDSFVSKYFGAPYIDSDLSRKIELISFMNTFSKLTAEKITTKFGEMLNELIPYIHPEAWENSGISVEEALSLQSEILDVSFELFNINTNKFALVLFKMAQVLKNYTKYFGSSSWMIK